MMEPLLEWGFTLLQHTKDCRTAGDISTRT